MGYTFKNAKEDFFDYLGILPESVTYIPNSKEFGIELKNPETDEICVVFISAVGRNTSSPKMYFDTRDSYPKERIITRNYARKNNLKFFFLGVRNETDCKINDYFISLEANETQIQSNSGKASANSKERGGNQVNLPSTFTFTKKTERLKSDKGFFFSAIYKDKLWDYMHYFDNRPYEEETLEEERMMNMDNNIHLNRIIFGAPGTGKSFELNKRMKTEFLSQDKIILNQDELIKTEIQENKRNWAALLAIGMKYSSYFKDMSVKQIAEKFSCTAPYPIYRGSQVNEITKIMDSFTDEDSDVNIKDLVESVTKDKELTWIAIGMKYENLLLGKTIPQITADYKLNPSSSAASWLYDAANCGQYHDDGEQKNKVSYYERVTFHPNYSYSQFVGTYKPVQDDNIPDNITYKYVPGPFMRVYVNAKNNPKKKFLLLIEEINRANVAAVFGDVFQLLDRDETGKSEYPITASEDVKKYLRDCGIEEDELIIPSNMYIWATMNSADQGVLPMDAAFKRRWDFEYLDIDENEDKVSGYVIPISLDGKKTVNWNELRKAINDKLTDLGINEDKLLGPFFMSDESLRSAMNDSEKFVKLFESKVIMYLFEDVVKMKQSSFFNASKMRYSLICKEFEEKGLDVFKLLSEVPAKNAEETTEQD